jgi:hypothetical protein
MEIKNTHYHHHLDSIVVIHKIFTFSVYLILLLPQSGTRGIWFSRSGHNNIIWTVWKSIATMPVRAHFSGHIKQGYAIPWVPGIDCQLLLESRVLIWAQIWQCRLNKSCAKPTNDFFEERNLPNSPYFEGKFLVISIFRHYYITWDHKKQSRILKIYYITIWPIAKFRAFVLWIHRTLKKIMLAKFCSFNL